jgi:phosphomannomutase
MIEQDLLQRMRRFLDADPDMSTQRELAALLEDPAKNEVELRDRFAGELEFGTAGLRGVIGAGPNRMNRAVVRRATFGLGTHLLQDVPGAKEKGVVIGYDGRRLSREFAEDTACTLAALGIRTYVFPDVVPTPLCAYGVKHLGAAAGVMVTASHNPPEYNGYKAYWTNGAQIIPPTDAGIAAAIDKAPAGKDVPRMDLAAARAEGLIKDAPAEVEAEYLKQVAALSVVGGASVKRDLRIVYTALHGVGDRLARKALQNAGFTNVFSVPEQAEPNGEFPTVRFPNPEEKGAMDLSFALARKENAALVLANDPDADRLAAAIPDATQPSGYMQFTGNQVGVLLGHHLLTRGDTSGARVTIASLVSSPMLGVMAKKLGVRYEETLTGFKWIANRAMELAATSGERFVFGYEEALGYTVGELVRDKDGISAAVALAEQAALLAAEGKTLGHELERLYREFGLFVSSQVNVTRKGQDGAKELRAMMDRLRANVPAQVGGLDVVAVSDYQAQTRQERGSSSAIALPKSNVVSLELEDGTRIIARPSGTEPKAKFYFDICEQVAAGEPMAQALGRATDKQRHLEEAFGAFMLGG